MLLWKQSLTRLQYLIKAIGPKPKMHLALFFLLCTYSTVHPHENWNTSTITTSPVDKVELTTGFIHEGLLRDTKHDIGHWNSWVIASLWSRSFVVEPVWKQSLANLLMIGVMVSWSHFLKVKEAASVILNDFKLFFSVNSGTSNCLCKVLNKGHLRHAFKVEKCWDLQVCPNICCILLPSLSWREWIY